MKRLLIALTFLGSSLSFQSCGYMLTALIDGDDSSFSSSRTSSSSYDWSNNNSERTNNERSRVSRTNSLCP